MQPIKDIMEIQEKQKALKGVPMYEKQCECGNTYNLIELGENEVIDPLKCDDCIKKGAEEENQEIVNRANRKIAYKKFEPYRHLINIPPGCENATFENYEPQNDTQRKALETSKEFIQNVDINSNKSLMFQGSPGIGKSHLSVAMHKALRDQFITTVILDTPTLFSTLKHYFSYPDSQQAQDKLMRNLRNVDVLILDDIGSEYVKSNDGRETWASDIMYQIMNDRQTKVNVFSTNYKSADLKEKYGSLSSRIISRMLSGAEVVKIEGQDQRMKGFE